MIKQECKVTCVALPFCTRVSLIDSVRDCDILFSYYLVTFTMLSSWRLGLRSRPSTSLLETTNMAIRGLSTLPSCANNSIKASIRPENHRFFPSVQQQQQQQRYQQVREKHSRRHVKRMQTHPAKLRVEQRLSPEEGSTADSSTPVELPPPRFPPIFTPELLPNGWSKPPAEDSAETTALRQYPFFVARTSNKPNDAAGFLPIYTHHRKDGTKVTTRIKKVTGDVDIFLDELKRNKIGGDATEIRIRTGGTIELKGNHVKAIKLWLAGLGF